MPWVIGVVAESAGLAAGMMTNIVPCVGLVIFAIFVAKLPFVYSIPRAFALNSQPQ